MDLLAYLARHPGEVLSHDQILSGVWPHKYVTDSALQTAVSALRKALDDDAKIVLVTVPKRGYQLAAEVVAISPVLGILPFTDLQSHAQRPHLTDGVTDLLISALGHYQTLQIISRHSMTLATRTDPTVAARELGATHLLEGSVHSEGSKVTVSVRLIDVAQDTYVWTHTHISRVQSLISDQNELAALLVNELTSSNGPADATADHLDVSAEAMEAYLHGRYHWNKLNPEHFPVALKHFERAVQLNPVFPTAHAGIADVWGAYGYWGMMPGSEVGPNVLSALERARVPDPQAAEVQMMEGAYAFHLLHDWDAAQDHLRQAVARKPNLAQAHLLTGLVLGTRGDPAAFAAIETARQLDPLAAPVLFAQALILAGAGRYEAVAGQLDSLRDLDPEFPPGLELKADLAWVGGDNQAIELERALWRQDPEISTIMATAAEPLQKSAECLHGRNSYHSPRVIARLYSLAGNHDAAIRVLAAALAANDLMQIDFVMMAPSFHRVRQHVAFTPLADRLALRTDR